MATVRSKLERSKEDDLLEQKLYDLTQEIRLLQLFSHSTLRHLVSSTGVLICLSLYRNVGRYFQPTVITVGQWYVDTYALFSIVVYLLLLLFCAATVRSLVRFSAHSRVGETLYYEIADLIDWGSRRKKFIYEPNTTARQTISQFLNARELLFTKNQNGPVVYSIYLLILITGGSILLLL